MSDATQVRARVAAVTEGFLARLPARFATIEAGLVLCQAEPGNEGHWQELRRLVHSLAGAAGTFGLATLGAAAREHDG